MYKKLLCLFLCLILPAVMVVPVCAAEDPNPEKCLPQLLSISSVEEFLTFAEACRLDVYSQNLEVSLESDLDLNGYDFNGIPIFSGVFDGQNHRISGLDISVDGSMQGLFRHLTAAAVVKDLTVTGTVTPGGSKNSVGAIAGRNDGQILRCIFSGTVVGGDYIGGIAGSNRLTGLIENCHVDGAIYGNHFVGGIAGENTGVIRSCSNNALINTTPQQNSVEISDISLDTLTNTESPNTVTDIGGIAGISNGVIRNCENKNDVGYRHMGYNIGGIAGTQSGYLIDCVNSGDIQGRKEVGGIIGQLEPAAKIEYTEDTLQILQGQLNTMSGLVNRASGNAQSNTNGITSQIGVLQDQTQTALDAIDTLFQDSEFPDADKITAAQNTLSASLSEMPDTLSNIASATQNTIYSLSRDLNAISGQINAMSQTINNASENLGGTITDISDLDTPDLLTGKAAHCVNTGDILADLNAGGIAGALAMENDADILEDWQTNGDESLNFQSEVRAVILDCKNTGTVTAKKQNAGGIAGWQSVGLIKRCENKGTIDSPNADYVGGITGLSTGYIREVSAKCEISGVTYVGGIAGSGTIVTDSYAQTKLCDVREKEGAILGFAEQPGTDEENPIRNNYYLRFARDPGAIDGISYAELAEPKELDAFLTLKDLPNLFQTVSVSFLFPDGRTTEYFTASGTSLIDPRIPDVPVKDGYTGKWDGLEDADLTNLLFDLCFEAVYTPLRATIESELTRENGLPIVLAEGTFSETADVTVLAADLAPILLEEETLQETWNIRLNESSQTLRFQLPMDINGEHVKLMVQDTAENWNVIPCSQDGRYLVFTPNSTNIHLAVVKTPSGNIAAYAGAVIILLILFVLLFKKKRKNTTAHPASNNAAA